jgi:hypothetical protein
MSEQDKSPPTPTPDALPRTHADGYQPGSNEPAGSRGYQSASEEPPSSTEVPESLSAEEDDEGLDPYEAFAEAAATARERKKRDREPGTWMPGSDEFDHELGREDAETRFSRDSWGGRGNPQVSVRLRPRDFERLRRAADLYGVRPTTFARMMVIRGTGAVIEADNVRKAQFLKDP